MNLQKFSPWNWFKSENADAPSRAVAPRGGEPSPLVGMHRELDRWMDGMLRQFGLPAAEGALGESPTLLRPRLDIAEHDDHYAITVEVPGVEEKDLSLSLDDRRLVIEGEKRQEHRSGEDRYQRVERSYGSFRRVLDLPDDAQAEGIEARFDSGVLNVRVPRSAQPTSSRRQIPIQG